MGKAVTPETVVQDIRRKTRRRSSVEVRGPVLNSTRSVGVVKLDGLIGRSCAMFRGI